MQKRLNCNLVSSHLHTTQPGQTKDSWVRFLDECLAKCAVQQHVLCRRKFQLVSLVEVCLHSIAFTHPLGRHWLPCFSLHFDRDDRFRDLCLFAQTISSSCTIQEKGSISINWTKSGNKMGTIEWPRKKIHCIFSLSMCICICLPFLRT